MIKLAKIWLSISGNNQLFREKMIPKINGWRPASCFSCTMAPLSIDDSRKGGKLYCGRAIAAKSLGRGKLRIIESGPIIHLAPNC